MDSNDIDVHDATVRREPSQASAGLGGGAVVPQERSAEDGRGLESPGAKLPNDKAIEDAKTVISQSHGSSVPSQPADGGSPAEVARVLLGHQLDHFYLENLIGGGGMGAVFRASDTRLDRTVAIKVIPRVGDDAELQRRFRNEAQSAARLDHPNIARVYDVGQHGGWHYIVFEYIDGVNLRDLVHRDGVLNVDDAVYYTRQVAEALDHAHRRGVVHRDIKPSNVLITTTGQAKLVDMGLARAQQLEMSEDMTASGVTLGTFDYISPEQARDPRDADVRSDIYSLGCTLYFSLTGRAPYPSGTVLQKLLSHGSSPPPDPRKVRKDLSANLVAVLHKMLAKQPQDRYRRPLDLISDLYQLAELEGLPRSLSAGSIAIAPTNRFAKLVEYHLPWVAAVLLLFLSAGWMQILSSASSDLDLTSVPPRTDVNLGNEARNGTATGRILTSPSPESQQSNQTNGERRSDGTASLIELGESPNEGTNYSNGARNAGDAVTPLPTEGVMTGTDETTGQKGAANTSGSTLNNTVTNGASTNGNSRNNPTNALNVPEISSAEDLNSPSTPGAGRLLSGRIQKVIRVVPNIDAEDATDFPEDRLIAGSLTEAFAFAERDNSLTVIEIQGRLAINARLKLPRRGLIIRGTSDDSSLDFGVWAPTSTADRWLFDVGNNNLEIESLHIRWQIPSMAMNPGSIFRMAGGNTVRLSDCTITIDDPDGNASANAFVYAPESLTDLNGSEAINSVPSPNAIVPNPIIPNPTGLDTVSVPAVANSTVGISRLVAIQLRNCIVRGRMTFLQMERAGLLELKWDNGLLSIDGCMLRSKGADSVDEFNNARARIIMDDVTTVLGESLVNVDLAGRFSQPFLIDREANRCVFSWGAQVSLINIDGVPSEFSEDRLLILRGSDNHYDAATDPGKLFVQLNGSQNSTVRLVSMAEMLGMNAPKWAMEQSPQGVVNWSTSLPATGQLHRTVPGDYLQEGVVLPGFRTEELPKLASP